MAGKRVAAGSPVIKIGSSSNCAYTTCPLTHASPRWFRGAPGNLEAAEIDTANFVGNYPESAELHATLSEKVRNASSDTRFDHLDIP